MAKPIEATIGSIRLEFFIACENALKPDIILPDKIAMSMPDMNSVTLVSHPFTKSNMVAKIINIPKNMNIEESPFS